MWSHDSRPRVKNKFWITTYRFIQIAKDTNMDGKIKLQYFENEGGGLLWRIVYLIVDTKLINKHHKKMFFDRKVSIIDFNYNTKY